MSEIKLKRCPFCGGEARLMCVEETGEEYCINYEDELEVDCSFVHCYNCDMDFMPQSGIAKEVLEAWNTRKPIEKVLERLEVDIDTARETAIRLEVGCQARLCMNGIKSGLRTAIEIVKEVGGMNET